MVGEYASLPLCHIYINNQLSGSQTPSITVILATTVSYSLLKMTQWLYSESDLHFLCSDAGILARKPASLQGNFKVPKNMDFLGDFAHFSIKYFRFWYEPFKIIAILGGFELAALSRRPWLWPATVLARLNSGRPTSIGT